MKEDIEKQKSEFTISLKLIHDLKMLKSAFKSYLWDLGHRLAIIGLQSYFLITRYSYNALLAIIS